MSTPFLGEFKMATEATGAESGTDYSGNFVSTMVDPTGDTIEYGPYLSTNFKYHAIGPFSVPIKLVMEGLTQVQIKALHANFAARSLMEFKYMAFEGTIDSPSTTNMQWTVQFSLPKPPPMSTVVGDKARWEFDINAQAASLDDGGGTPVTYGTLTAS